MYNTYVLNLLFNEKHIFTLDLTKTRDRKKETQKLEYESLSLYEDFWKKYGNKVLCENIIQ